MRRSIALHALGLFTVPVLFAGCITCSISRSDCAPTIAQSCFDPGQSESTCGSCGSMTQTARVGLIPALFSTTRNRCECNSAVRRGRGVLACSRLEYSNPGCDDSVDSQIGLQDSQLQEKGSSSTLSDPMIKLLMPVKDLHKYVVESPTQDFESRCEGAYPQQTSSRIQRDGISNNTPVAPPVVDRSPAPAPIQKRKIEARPASMESDFQVPHVPTKPFPDLPIQDPVKERLASNNSEIVLKARPVSNINRPSKDSSSMPGPYVEESTKSSNFTPWPSLRETGNQDNYQRQIDSIGKKMDLLEEQLLHQKLEKNLRLQESYQQESQLNEILPTFDLEQPASETDALEILRLKAYTNPTNAEKLPPLVKLKQEPIRIRYVDQSDLEHQVPSRHETQEHLTRLKAAPIR